jgi:hypothetical protein
MQITEHSTSVLTLQEKESFFPARRHLWKTLLAALLLYPLVFLLPSLLGESLTMTCTCSKGQGTSCTIAKTGVGKNPLRINYLLEKEVVLLSGLLIFGMGIAFLVQGREYPVAAFLFFISGLWLCFTFFVLGRDIFSGKGKKE